ncbi:MAG: leucine-rich repeat domain-containing protein [bacterium]
MVNLTGLGLSRNHLSTIDLSYAPGLKYLSLSHNDFDTIDLSAVT